MQFIVVAARKSDGKVISKGNPISKELAEARVKQMNTQYPDLKHWAEPVISDR